MKKAVFILTLFVIASAAAGCASKAEPPAAPAQETLEINTDSVQEQPDLVQENSMLSPELLKDRILTPAIAFHPGTAGSMLQSAQAAAKILSFCTEHQLRQEDEEHLDRMMKDAYALLYEDEKGWLQENLPGLIGLIDSMFADYDKVKGMLEDSGADDMAVSALAAEHSQEDWSKARAALEGLEDGVSGL